MKALFAGSFDPFHNGHLHIVERASSLFRELHVVVGVATEKQVLIPIEERVSLIRESVQHLSNVVVQYHQGLTISYAKQHHISVLIRGLRLLSDFEYEQSMAWHNRLLAPQLETIFFMTHTEYQFVSSRAIKELIKHHEDVSRFLPPPVQHWIKNALDQL